jgi:hypothetical protein
MALSRETIWTFQIASGVLWTLTYLLIIKRAFQDKALGTPVAALCANIAWEAIFAFIHPHRPPQLYVNVVWFGFEALSDRVALKTKLLRTT